MNEQIGLFRMKLSQRRFEEGAFYLSAIFRDTQLAALDGRFYVERGKGLQPTRSGFRIPSEQIDRFKAVVDRNPREIGDIVLFKNSSFRFHIRYVNDEYGEGIDFRKYRTTEKQTGWVKAGIRMKLEDIDSMKNWIKGYSANELIRSKGIFSATNIIQRDNEQDVVAVESHVPVNPIITEIINS